MGGNRQTTLTTNGHASNANIPALDDFTLSQLERKWRALLVCYFPDVSARMLPKVASRGERTIKDLAVLELANIAHANLVANLGSSASANLAVVNGDTLKDLDAWGSLLRLVACLGLLSRRAGGAQLQVLSELDLLLGLGRLLFRSHSLALIVLELLGLLFAQLGIGLLGLLGDKLIQAIGGRALVLTLLRLHQLGGLLLIRVDFLHAAGTIEIVELVLGVTTDQVLHVRGQVVVAILVVRVLLAVGCVVQVDHVVTSEVYSVRTGVDEKGRLTSGDAEFERLLVVLHHGRQSIGAC